MSLCSSEGRGKGEAMATTAGMTAMGAVKRGFAQCPDGNIEYLEVGSGEPLILLHATPASCLAYRDVAPLLADRYRCIAMSTMGYGQSDRPSRPYTSLSQFARAVTWLMDGLGIERAHLYGNSTGSNIAAVVAAEHSERIDRLVLTEIFNWGTPSRRELHEGLHRYVPERPDGGHLLELWRQAGRPPGEPESEDLDVTTREFVHRLIVNSKEGADAYGEMGWEGAGPYAMTRTDIWEVVARIIAPTLVIHGSTSDLARPNERFVEAIPGARGIVLPSRGVFFPQHAPDQWARVVGDFLAAGDLAAIN